MDDDTCDLETMAHRAEALRDIAQSYKVLAEKRDAQNKVLREGLEKLIIDKNGYYNYIKLARQTLAKAASSPPDQPSEGGSDG